MAGPPGVVDPARHHSRGHHGLLHPGGSPGAVRPGQGLRRLRSLVFIRAHRDAAQPGVRLRGNQPGAHGRQDAHVHLAVDLRAAGVARGVVGDLRLRRAAAHEGHVHRYQRGRGEPFRAVHRLHRGGRGRDTARVHVPGAELEFHRQQPAPELRRGPGRAVHPRRVRGAPGRSRMGADAAGHHLRRARRLLRPRAAAGRRGPAGPGCGRVRFRLHPVRGAGPRRSGLTADRSRAPCSGCRRGARRSTTRRS